MKESWAFTIKQLSVKDKPLRSTYEYVFITWRNMGVLFDYVTYELDSRGKLHAHGVIELNHNFLRKRLVRKDMGIKLDRLVDAEHWHAYCTKINDAIYGDRIFGTIQKRKNVNTHFDYIQFIDLPGNIFDDIPDILPPIFSPQRNKIYKDILPSTSSDPSSV